MTTPNDGGPAFPPVHDPNTHPHGMSLRDYFASKAMAGRLSQAGEVIDIDAFTDNCYEMADAMLRAREVPRG